MTDSELLLWAAAELERQMQHNRVCRRCGAEAAVGYHATCHHCGEPVCGRCAVQVDGGHFCPACPKEPPF
jgi:hypothetical protein